MGKFTEKAATRPAGTRGRPRKAVAAARKVARVSNDDGNEMPTSTSKSQANYKKRDSADDSEPEVEEPVGGTIAINEQTPEEDEPNEAAESSNTEEQVEPPSFSLATLGLQRVGSAPPPKPKVQKPPILTLNARGMPARIRKRNPLFFDENIINDDKPLRVSLAPKKLSTRGLPDSPGKLQMSPAKVLKKRKGVVSRYMRSTDDGNGNGSGSGNGTSSDNLASSDGNAESVTGGKPRKSVAKTLLLPAASSSKGQSHSGRGANSGAKSAAAAAAKAAAEDKVHSAEALASGNKRLGQSIGLRLRNLLKLPKAHKWAIAEWFYSYIDKPLFDCKSEFLNQMRDLAPQLGTHKLNRHEWMYLRWRIGRPRRCSAAFFSEERRELERKRQLMRTLQSCKPGELKDTMVLMDMPDKIPMPLPLGTKVTARLRTPQDGIFGGTVAAYDSVNAMYRVTFERAGLGTQSIPDFEIVSENFHEMLPVHSFTKDFRPNLMSIYNTNGLGFTTDLGYTTNLASSFQSKCQALAAANSTTAATGIESGAGITDSPTAKHLPNSNAAARNALSMKLNKSDPLLGQDSISESPLKQQLSRNHGYSPELLKHLVLLQNYIALKKAKVDRLREMNNTAEMGMGELLEPQRSGDRSRKVVIRDDFQRRYASNIISLERINVGLGDELAKVQELSVSLTRNPNVQAMISPTLLREECRAKANIAVDEIANDVVKNERMLGLVKNLATLLMVAQRFEGGSDSAEVHKVLEGCLEEVRSNLISADNAEHFVKNVQVRLHYIVTDINRNVEERNLNQSSMRSPKSESSEETADTAASNKADDEMNRENVDTNAKKDQHLRKEQVQDTKPKPGVKKDKLEKVAAAVEDDWHIEPMEVDSDHSEISELKKKKLDDDVAEDDPDADADEDAVEGGAEGETDGNVEGEAETEGSDAADISTTSLAALDATDADPSASDTQITIESMNEFEDDESQDEDKQTAERPESPMSTQ